MHAIILLIVDDVTSISWINALFACFIALIEIGRYSHHQNKNNNLNFIMNYEFLCINDIVDSRLKKWYNWFIKIDM